jgi:curved DNA-binding protein CbpA
MQLKDYYKILGLEPSASISEIRKAYRNLAQQFHPDKNPGDQYAADKFEEIKEAYEVLTNPSKKENYLRQRWYEQSQGRKNFKTEPSTPEELLKQSLELYRYSAGLDTFRIDREGLATYIRELLSDKIIQNINRFKDRETTGQIIRLLIKTSRNLLPQQLREIGPQLYKLANKDEISIELVTEFLKQHKKENNWRQYKVPLMLLLTILLCFLIYFATR